MVELTEYEAEVVVDFIEMCFVECIKADGADSLQWMNTLLNVWRKCGGKYDDDKAEVSCWIVTRDGYKCPDCKKEILLDDVSEYLFCPSCGRRRINESNKTVEISG